MLFQENLSDEHDDICDFVIVENNYLLDEKEKQNVKLRKRFSFVSKTNFLFFLCLSWVFFTEIRTLFIVAFCGLFISTRESFLSFAFYSGINLMMNLFDKRINKNHRANDDRKKKGKKITFSNRNHSFHR